MIREYSIAVARDHFTEIVRQAEAGDEVRLTRRGKPVAVLVSEDTISTLRGRRPSFIERTAALRAEIAAEGIDMGDVFEGLRDDSPGREVDLWD